MKDQREKNSMRTGSRFSIFVTTLVIGVLVWSAIAAGYDYGTEFIAHWVLSDSGSTVFSDVDRLTYDVNALIVTDFISMLDFDCNSEFKITVTKSGWTLPADYPASGAKHADGSDADLLLMVDNVISGYPPSPSEGLHPLGTYATYTAVTTSGSEILGGGVVGSHGVANASCDLNAKILMDWATDIVGTYSITVTLTISEVTN